MKCPYCETGIIENKICGGCGVEQKINGESGNVIYMRGGRLVGMPQDKKDRVDKMKKIIEENKPL